jgi:hypothetical protein
MAYTTVGSHRIPNMTSAISRFEPCLPRAPIKHEITEADDNVYKKGFVVDANVETRAGRPISYRASSTSVESGH